MTEVILLISCIFYTVLLLVSNYYTFNFALKLGMRSNRKEGEKAVFESVPGFIKPKVAIRKPDLNQSANIKVNRGKDLPEGIIRKGDF